MAGAKHLLIEFSIHHRLEGCVKCTLRLFGFKHAKVLNVGRISQKIHLVSIGLVTPMFLTTENHLTVFAKLSTLIATTDN